MLENSHAVSAAKFVSYFDSDTGEFFEFASSPHDGQELKLPDVLFNGNDTAHGACAPTSPSTDLSKCALVHDSPTSVLFFDDSEAEQKDSLSSPDFTHPGISTTSLKTQISAFDISSVYLKESGSLYFKSVQGFPSYWISAAACGSDPPSPLIASTFFSYWFDGFVPFQCFCFCVIIFLFIWFDGFALNKAYFLDFLCSKAGLRNAKSVRPNLSNIQGDMDLRVSESKFSTGFFLSMTFVLGAAVDPLLPSSSFVWFDGFALIESYSLDLLCSTAGLRIAKSVRPNLSNIQGDIDQRVSESKFSAGPFPSMTFALGAAVDLILPSTSLLNSA
jgi:hypothetical protein